MNLTMDDKVAENYKSNSQKIRVITEQWVSNNLFCPYCGKEKIAHFENNRPVADFYCPDCAEEYELKSKNGTIENKVNDGAYDTMIKRIESINNPNFFFMNYNKQDLHVKDFLMVPKYFFSPEIIEKRKPLSDTARRRGWVLDVLNCVNQIEGRDFTLEQMYKFEDVLSKKHPDNNHIKDKIRQKLQILRDKGILEFRGRGHYRKI